MHTPGQVPSWTNSPSNVHDHFTFSQSNFQDVTTSKSARLGQSAHQHAQKAPNGNTVFSQLFLHSISAMKVRRRKHSPTSAPKHIHLRIKSIPPTLYDDPAFSPDPHSHPFFAASHDTAWAPPLLSPSNPSLKNDPRPSFIPPAVNHTDKFNPPNHLMSPNDARNDPPSSATIKSGLNASRTPPSSAPSSSDSHLAPATSDPVEPPPQKKRNPIIMFWRKKDPLSPDSDDLQLERGSQEPPPSYETVASRDLTIPEIHQPSGRLNMPSRPDTTAENSNSAPAISRLNINGHRGRPRRLDRIDELDETNPFGLPVHHGSPYEVVQKVVKQYKPKVPYNVGSQYQNKFMSAPSEQFPIGAPLNLVPGQILPHNFYQQGPARTLDPSFGHLHQSSHTQALAHKQESRPWGEAHTPGQRSGRHNSMPVPRASASQQGHRDMQSEEFSTPRKDRLGHTSNIEHSNDISTTPFQQHESTNSYKNTRGSSIVPSEGLIYGDGRPYENKAQVAYSDSNAQLSSTAEAYLAANNEQSRPLPLSDSGRGVRKKAMTSHTKSPEPPQSSQASDKRFNQSSEKIHHPDPALQNDLVLQKKTDRDTRSTNQSMFSSGGSSNSHSGGRILPHHLPKQLVMPTPLQPSHVQLTPSTSQLALHFPHSQPQPHGRAPPRPSALPPILNPQVHSQPPRAQDIPMSEGRKLRKRPSVGGVLVPPVIHPVATVSFSANVVEPRLAAALPEHSKAKKTPKKVLSKRRTDL